MPKPNILEALLFVIFMLTQNLITESAHTYIKLEPYYIRFQNSRFPLVQVYVDVRTRMATDIDGYCN